MMPHTMAAIVLALGAYRLTRLGGWDDWPPIYKLRAWIIGERWVPVSLPPCWKTELERSFESSLASAMAEPIVDPDVPARSIPSPQPPELPGKQPTSEVSQVRAAYDRPLLAHLVHCPFCLGWWVSLAVYIAWLLEPRWTLYAVAPFALSGAVGIIAKNLDA